MQRHISLSIFFPAYNEEANIREAVEKAVRVVEDSPYITDYEIIVVDDGSTDRTAEYVRALEQRYPAVRLVSHQKNRGYGAALKSGIAAARMEYVFFTDADLQFDLVELQNLLVHIPVCDVVVGYRAPRRDPFMRLVNARGWNLLNQLLFGLHIIDIDSAFKLFRRDVIQSLPLKSNGAMVSAEMLIRLQRAGYSVKEIPVSHAPRRAGSPTGAKVSVIVRALREMIQLYRGELGAVGHKEALKFTAVGVINTLLDATVYIFLTRFFGMGPTPVAAKFFSFMSGTITSLFLNRSWTFGIRSGITMREIARFYITVSANLVLNLSLMYFFVHGLLLYDLAALALTTVLTFTFSFAVSKWWVFRPAQRDAIQPI